MRKLHGQHLLKGVIEWQWVCMHFLPTNRGFLQQNSVDLQTISNQLQNQIKTKRTNTPCGVTARMFPCVVNLVPGSNYVMSKRPIHIEKLLHAKTPNHIWQHISTGIGLSRWFADKVEQHENTLTITWGEPPRAHETRTATVVLCEKDKVFRFRWDDETHAEAFIELAMERGEITNDWILRITDYAEADEVDYLHTLWTDNLNRLHQNTGL